jgi:hypothetical protein
VELRQKYLPSNLTLTLQVMQFLKSWLADHIMGHDHQNAGESKPNSYAAVFTEPTRLASKAAISVSRLRM